MKRKFGLLSLLALIAVSLAVVGSAGASRHVSSPITGSLTYCDNPTFPPMESTTTGGKDVGFDIDMAAAIAQQWKVKSKFVFSSFSGLLPALAAKRCVVVISGIFITPDRTAKFPAVSYMHTHRALLVKGGNPKHIKSPNDLSGKTAAVQSGTKYEIALRALDKKLRSEHKKGIKIYTYPGDTDAVQQILIGRADVVLTQDTECAFQIGKHPGKLAIAYLYPQTDQFGIYYRKSDTKIGSALSSTIATLKSNGTLAKLAAKYKIPTGDVK